MNTATIPMLTRAERIRIRSKARRDTKDADVLPGHERTARVDLGLALLECLIKPGQSLTRYDIACWCGVTDAAIYRLEVKVLVKLRNKIQFGRHRGLHREVEIK